MLCHFIVKNVFAKETFLCLVKKKKRNETLKVDVKEDFPLKKEIILHVYSV